jgi:phosphoenolpyruvate-protein kinase (PTS system EI component)
MLNFGSPADQTQLNENLKGDQPMNSTSANLEEFKKASTQWKDRIARLWAKAEDSEGDQKEKILELLETLRQQEALIGQYVRLAESKENNSWEKKAVELDRMLKDIDDTYRKALPFFY